MKTDHGPPDRRKTCLIVCLAAAALAQAGCRKPDAQAAPPPPTVGVVEARRMTVPVLANPNGTTRAIQEVAVRARVRGFLTELHFQEGSFVKKDQLLFVIDEATYKVALRSARAKQAEAQAAVKKAEQSKGREVAAAQLALDDAQLNLGVIEERRSRNLLSRNAGSREDVDKAEANRKKLEAQVEADRANLEQVKADYEVSILSAQAQADAAAAAVLDAEINLGYCRMSAPIDGRIGEAKVKVGNLVGPDAAGGGSFSELATIQQLDPMSVDIRASSRFLARATRLINRGLSVRLTRPGLEGDEAHPHEGECYFIDNTIDPTTSTFLVKARVPNPQGTLLPGEYVKVNVQVDRIENAVVVPETAVMETEAGPVVYLVDREGKVAIQRVEAAQSYEGFRVIMSGLDSGVPVIVQGLQLVRPGVAVKTEPAVLARPAGGGPGGARDSGAAPSVGAGDTPPAKSETKHSGGPAVQPGGPRSAVEAAKPATTGGTPGAAGGPQSGDTPGSAAAGPNH
jgi:membrane fusion protein, multidrug efflux system